MLPAQLELAPDKRILHANGSDLSFITVKIKDSAGTLVPDADALIHFEISGAGFIAGADNGDPACLESFKALQHKAYNGLCLVVVQSDGRKGPIRITATSSGLRSANITLQCR